MTGQPQGILPEFDLVQSFRRLVRGWYWLILAGLVGAIVGGLVSAMRPPVYEATATLGIGIDRARAEVPDDVTVRQAYDRVRGLLLADDTLERALVLAGRPATREAVDALHGRLRLAEAPAGWELSVTGVGASDVENLAQSWAQAALDGLAEASVHAIRASEWQSILYEASCRLMAPDPGSSVAVWHCTYAPPTGDASQISPALMAEVEASRGILPAFSYTLLRSAIGTARTVLWIRGTLILAGALLGLILGGILVAGGVRLPERPASTAT